MAGISISGPAQQTLIAGPQTLTNKTTSGTSEEQWGTEELVIDDALLVGTTVKGIAFLSGFAERNDLTSVTGERGASVWLEVSLDGGSTFTSATTGGTTIEWHGDENTVSRKPIFAQVVIDGTITGDIQIRASVVTFHAAAKPLFKDGVLTAIITAS